MADLTREVALSHREAPHQTGYSAKEKPPRKRKQKSVQLIARKFAAVLKFDEAKHPRDKDGRFVDAEGVTHVGEFVELYHGTSRRRANKILKEGFKIRAVAKQTMGGDPESSRNYIWLAKRPGSAQSYSELHLNPTVLTVRLPTTQYEALKRRHSGPDSVWSPEAIPAKYVSLKYDPAQPRDEQGQWAKTTGRTFTSEEGYQWHEKGPVAEWAKNLPHADNRALDSYAGFGYHDTNDLRRGTYKVPIKEHFVRAATAEEMRRVGWDPEKNEWVPSIKVKEGEYKTGYPVDPRDVVTPETIERFGHPMGKNKPQDYDPEDPYNRVDDGRIVVNQYYRPVPDGPPMMFSIQRAGPDLERLAQVQKDADALDNLIANRGYELPEAIVVERGAYLPGVTFEQLQDMQYEGPNGEPPPVWEEKGFTSTMVGDAGGRTKSYPALGKWESIMHRHGSSSGVLLKHQDEVGSAVRFHITLPAGTKVASVEASRRLRHEFPRIPNPEPMGPKELADPFWQQHPELWQVTDYTQAPTVDATDLEQGKEGRRTESELLLGSGARFRVTKARHGETYQTGDPTLKPVKMIDVYLEYIGGGSSEGTRTH